MEPAERDDAAPIAKPKVKLKRGRRADPNRAPPTFLRRLSAELAAECMARQEARRADPQYLPPPMFAPRARMSNAEVFEKILLTPAQKARRRTKELQEERAAKAARAASAAAFVLELKAEREAAAKRAADRKAAGIKLSYAQWREEVDGCTAVEDSTND